MKVGRVWEKWKEQIPVRFSVVENDRFVKNRSVRTTGMENRPYRVANMSWGLVVPGPSTISRFRIIGNGGNVQT